ncbi:GGDEF domain-containing protein [Paenibacillus nanensis]|uniref:GGDEF domain-containing protein n=1 Tax=Paenibacillus nanensis TaxID=393251 RepID=A0A3A1USX2_9BACL|nr:GGDEF domain-containing protein [Paenibacillus nanensis]RIX46508.1 GGDEF domain-containing protein [Paenibacillus nanensis]
MDETGFGLMNDRLLQTVQEKWRQGGIAVLFLQMNVEQKLAQEAVREWEQSTSALFWRHQMEQNCLFLLDAGEGRGSIGEIADEAVKRLRERLAEALAGKIGTPGQDGWFNTNVSFVYPDPAKSADVHLFQSLAKACEIRLSNPKDSMPYINGTGSQSIGRLAAPIHSVAYNATVSQVSYLFDMDAKAQGVVVVREGRPVGLLMREKLYQLLAGQYGLSLYWNRPVEKIMDGEPLIVDEAMPVEQVSQLAMSRADYRLYDIVILTKDGLLSGVATIRAILECMTALRTEEARSANPLTGLPGNAGIQAELHDRISRGKPFAMIYADLDYFKWFNDCFGFGLGDELIRHLAGLLRSVTKQYAGSDSFVGHIGGDDFIVIMEPGAAEVISQTMIDAFDREVVSFYGDMDISEVEDRSGVKVQTDGVSLSLSVLIWDGKTSITPSSLSQLAAKAKKRVKAVKGSAYVIDQLTGMQHREERSRL